MYKLYSLCLKVGPYHFCKDIIWRHTIEEIHTRIQFQYVNVATHDFIDVFVLVKQERTATLAQTFAQDGVGDISTGFRLFFQTVILRVMAVSKPLLLWKDIPYPMTALVTLL